MVSIDDIRAALLEIASDYGIFRAYLFGSFARGEQSGDSDVDLVLELSAPLGFKRAKLHDDLERLIDAPVDLVFGEEQLYEPVRADYERDKVMVYAA